MALQTESFKKQYDKLNEIANELRTNPELDIDILLSKVKEAVACHKQCKERLEAATKELDSILQGTNAEEPTVLPASKMETLDDDIPF